MESVVVERAKRGQFTLIAEAGVNFVDIAKRDGISALSAAKRMVEEAAEAGIHAVKFQTYRPEALVIKSAPAYWDTTVETPDGSVLTQYQSLAAIGNLDIPDFVELHGYCEKCGVEFMTTPFDAPSADALDPCLAAHKIASADLTNHPLVAHIAKKGKPVLLSVGASNEDEIAATLSLIRSLNSSPLFLLHCVLEYPTPDAHANLRKITALQTRFPDVTVGYSDHTTPDSGFTVLKTAYALGARVIEKHYTLDTSIPGNDHIHALTPASAKRLLSELARLEEMLGSPSLCCIEGEREARVQARRSIVSACDIPAGALITPEMLTAKRPGTGFPADSMDVVAGSTAAAFIPADTVITPEMLK